MKNFDMSGCLISAKTETTAVIGGSIHPYPDVLTIQIYQSGKNAPLAEVTMLRIASSMNNTNKGLVPANYSMGETMRAHNKKLAKIADEMRITRNFPCVYACTDLDQNDLYILQDIHVDADVRRQGICTWILSNIQDLVRRATRERNPVCVYHPATSTPEYLMNLYIKCGWTPVAPDARTLRKEP